MIESQTKPVPKSPVEVVNTKWEPGERNVKRLARSELISVLLHHWDTGGEVGLHHHTDGDDREAAGAVHLALLATVNSPLTMVGANPANRAPTTPAMASIRPLDAPGA